MRYVPGFDEQIVDALASSYPDVEYEAIRAAGDQGVEEAYDAIRAILGSATVEKSNLIAAINAAADLCTDPDRIASALGHLIDHPDPEVERAVVEAFGTVGDPW